MKKLILVMLLGIFLIGLTSASLPHKQNTDLTVVINSNNATACNISFVQYPDNTINYFNKVMTKNGNSFNYTVTWSNFTQIGETCTGITCTDSFGKQVGSVCRDVTASGFNGTLGFYFLIFGIAASLIIAGFWIQDNWIIVLGSFALVFVGLFIMFFGIDIIKDTVYTWALGIILLMTGAYFGIRGTYEALHD